MSFDVSSKIYTTMMQSPVSQAGSCPITLNALTVDVEDWYHVCGVGEEPPLVPASQRRVAHNIERVLTLLAESNTKATFFVLGSVAELEPSMVPMIAAAGHEIASHGYSHALVPDLGPARFRDEVRRTGDILERQAGRRPSGFRAPQWSVSAATPWALAILNEEGYLYDSSFNPLRFVGDPQGPRVPFMLELPAGSLLEIPPMVTPSVAGNLPSGGGWGFRSLPMWLICGTVKKLNDDGNPAVFYLHPREMESCGPRIKLSMLREFIVYGPRSDAEKRLKYLLRQFSFCTLRQLAEQWKTA